MNLFFIRTKLQCLIAQEITRQLLPNQKYSVVFLYQHNQNEDSPTVYAIYEKFRSGSLYSIDVIGANGLIKNLISIAPAMLRTALSGGRCFLAVVDSVPVALSLWFFPKMSVETFDDGAFNLFPGSRLYGSGPMTGGGWKKRIARLLFPEGSTEWIRARARRHYTIFPGQKNILPDERVTTLNWDWCSFLNPSDESLLPSDVSVVVVGTPHDEYPDPDASRNVARRLTRQADLYIRHPREGDWLIDSKARVFASPAESLLMLLSRKNSLTVYHFNSTIGFTLRKVNDIKLVNLVDPVTRQLLRFS